MSRLIFSAFYWYFPVSYLSLVWMLNKGRTLKKLNWNDSFLAQVIKIPVLVLFYILFNIFFLLGPIDNRFTTETSEPTDNQIGTRAERNQTETGPRINFAWFKSSNYFILKTHYCVKIHFFNKGTFHEIFLLDIWGYLIHVSLVKWRSI